MAETSTVALVRPSEEDGVLAEATTRLRAELAAAGFEVEELVAEPDTDPDRQVAAAKLARTPIATLAISGAGDVAGVFLWIPDPKTHHAEMRRVDMGGVPRQRALSVLAVRAVELLRASLLTAAPRARPETTPAPKLPLSERPRAMVSPHGARGEEAASPPLSVSGELGAALLYGGRRVSAAFAPLVRFAVDKKAAGVRVTLVAPAFGAEVSAAGGTATLREELLSVDVAMTWPAAKRFAFIGAAGGGAYHWHIAGAGAGENIGHVAERWGGVVEAGIGALLRLGPRTALLLDAQALLLAPPLVVQIVGREGGRTGQPTLCTSLGLWLAL